MTSFDNAVPIVNQPFLYINGMQVSNDATTPNTILDVAAGICRDSTNTYDINLGNFNGQQNGQTANSVTLINSANVGLNGIDTGTFAEATLYYVYVVGDAVSGNQTGCMISLAQPSVGPLMPYGYNVYRHVGYGVTISNAAHFLLAYSSGNNNARKFFYDAVQSVGTTASSASLAAINLTKWVPLVNNIPVWLAVSFSGTANDTLTLQPGAASASGNAVVMTAQVTSQALTANVLVQSQNTLISSVLSPTINYKNSGTDTVAISVAGFEFYI